MIRVDTREPWEKIADHFTEIGAEWRLEKQDHKSDFTIDAYNGRKFGIQRKTCNDFVASIDDLKDDLFELRRNYRWSAILIEGNWQLAGDHIGLRRGRGVQQAIDARSWHNFLLSQQLRGCMLLRTTSLRETCKVLAWADDYLSGERSPPTDAAFREDPTVILRMFPNIGEKTARKIVDEFGSVKTALLNVDRWEEVDGIGPKTHGRIQTWLAQ